MTHIQYEPAVFYILPRESEDEQTKTTEPKQTSSRKTIGPIEEPREYLDTILLEEVPYEKAENGEPVFNKADVISLFEARKVADKNFPFFLSEEFAADFKRRNKDFVSFEQLKEKYNLVVTKCESLEKENEQLRTENSTLRREIEEIKSCQSVKELCGAFAVCITEHAKAKGMKSPKISDVIYVIAHCLDIKVYQKKDDPKLIYNEDGKNRRYYYGTIEGYIKHVVETGKGGRVTGETVEYREKLCESVKNEKSAHFEQNFQRLILKDCGN
jgi:cell division septum initiation protein DivIVA